MRSARLGDDSPVDGWSQPDKREPDSHSVAVLARVDRRNIPSQKMLLRWDFEEMIPGTVSERLGWWLLIVDR